MCHLCTRVENHYLGVLIHHHPKQANTETAETCPVTPTSTITPFRDLFKQDSSHLRQKLEVLDLPLLWNCKLLRLPRELRDMIYPHLFLEELFYNNLVPYKQTNKGSNAWIHCCSRDATTLDPHRLSIRLACRLLHNEVTEQLFASVQFRIKISDDAIRSIPIAKLPLPITPTLTTTIKHPYPLQIRHLHADINMHDDNVDCPAKMSRRVALLNTLAHLNLVSPRPYEPSSPSPPLTSLKLTLSVKPLDENARFQLFRGLPDPKKGPAELLRRLNRFEELVIVVVPDVWWYTEHWFDESEIPIPAAARDLKRDLESGWTEVGMEIIEHEWVRLHFRGPVGGEGNI